MNRALLAGVLAGVVSFAMMGCAAGVDDPIPTPPGPQAPHDPVEHALSGNGPAPVVDHAGRVFPTLDPQGETPAQIKVRPDPIPKPEPFEP